MHYMLESIIVGIYSLIIYIIVNSIVNIKNNYVKLYIVGFFKHFLSGYLNIHSYYCNYGYACYLKNDCKNGKCTSNKDYLFLESLLEGFLYLIVGFILIELPFNLKNIYIYFLIGFILHATFEWLKIHEYYCKKYCK